MVMKILLPAILAVGGLGAGTGAALVLRPEPEEPIAAQDCGPQEGPVEASAPDQTAATEFLEIKQRIIVPVLEDGQIAAMIVAQVSLEMAAGTSAAARERVPRLRDRLLRAFLDHANTGGFERQFTSNGSLDSLKQRLLDASKEEVGENVKDILILDINRQAA